MFIHNIKDKRVDKLLKAKGIVDSTVFYSPLSFWLITFIMILSSGIGIFYSMIVSKFVFLVIPYLLISYFISAYLNTCFALTTDQLIVINPNFPFRKFKIYSKQEIKKISIDKNRVPWFALFAVFGRNYVTIETNKGASFKYYCINLELDAYDENWTEETLDTFNSKLKEKGYPVEFNIDN